jgi:hypothetical protein
VLSAVAGESTHCSYETTGLSARTTSGNLHLLSLSQVIHAINCLFSFYNISPATDLAIPHLLISPRLSLASQCRKTNLATLNYFKCIVITVFETFFDFSSFCLSLDSERERQERSLNAAKNLNFVGKITVFLDFVLLFSILFFLFVILACFMLNLIVVSSYADI